MNISALTHQEHVKYIRRKNTDGFRIKYSLSHAERKDLVRECGVHALVLFEYYLRLASTENTPITDEAAADYFDWSLHTSRRWRQALTKKGWVSIQKSTLSNGRKIHVYYLGKEEVAGAANPVSKPIPKAPAASLPDEGMFDLPK